MSCKDNEYLYVFVWVGYQGIEIELMCSVV